jgi:RNA polymerase sigma-70 factor (ECF subfamily)
MRTRTNFSSAPSAPTSAERRDLLLVARARSGDQAAFDALVARNREAVEAAARGICTAAPGRVEEVVQDAFLSAWRSLAGQGIVGYDPARGPVLAWLVTIARARAIDAMRVVRLHERRVHGDGDAELARLSSPDTPAAGLLRAETAAELRAAVAALPDEQREVVELAYFREWSQSEIAAALAVPIGTVKGRLRLSYSRLRRSLSAPARPPRVGSAPVGRRTAGKQLPRVAAAERGRSVQTPRSFGRWHP